MPNYPELLPPDAPRWHVATVYHHQNASEKRRGVPPVVKHHELRYGNKKQEIRTGQIGLESLREIAAFLNRSGLPPKKRIECAADADNPAAYLHHLPYQSHCNF